MFALKRLIGGSLFVFFLGGAVLAQEEQIAVDKHRESVPAVQAAPLVTATATSKRVRFVSPGTVVQLRLEVYNEAGQKLFDTELRGGNVIDWHLQEGSGERVPAGSYATVLTIKSLSGRLSQRVGLVKVNGNKAAMEAAGTDQLSMAQQQAIGPVAGPVEGNTGFTILHQSETEAITAVAHDGVDGQVTSTTGALTFRTGDLFAGKDKEHMRITSEGNVGIGTDQPAATLDVAGTIRAEGGIRFDDGTMLKSASNSAGSRTDANGEPLPALNTSNTGTLGKLAKWTETGGAGGLGDSAVFEAGGLVGIGTTTPEANIHIQTPDTTVFKLVTTGNVATGRAVFQMYSGTSANPSGWDFGYNTDRSSERFVLRELGGGPPSTRFAISKGTGNVGIGTISPAAKLDVAGNINTSTGYYIGGNSVFRIAGTSNTFAGTNAGNSNTTGSHNSFFGFEAGYLTSTGGTNAFFGANAGRSNTDGGSNAFFGNAAGLSNVSGSNNSFFGNQAGNHNTANGNAFFGGSAGRENTNGNDNSFFGANAGTFNQGGQSNAFFGGGAGSSNVSGNLNSFFGHAAGFFNTASGNSFFGESAGHDNSSGTSNSFFGASAGNRNTTGSFNSFFGQNAGHESSSGLRNSFFGYSAGSSTTGASNDNSFFGNQAGEANSMGNSNSFFGASAGASNTTGQLNSFVGYSSGLANSAEHNNTFIGSFTNGAASITNATAVGYRAQVTQSNSLVLGGINTVNGATADTNVGIGTPAPTAKLHVVGNGLVDGDLTVTGTFNATLPSGNANYIQNNPASPQSASLNINGNGTIGGTLTAGSLVGNGSGVTNVPGTFKWQEVSGTAQQAQPNNGYVATNAGEVTITLPEAPNVGDTIRVAGAGGGGWKLVQNDGQTILTPNYSTLNWTGPQPWLSIASSADGNNLVAGGFGIQLYTSSDSGAIWTPRDSIRDWFSVASSSDGSKLVAAAFAGQIYTSTDFGAIWTPRDSNRSWVSNASSADGSNLVAVVSGGRIYTSTDSGANWTPNDSNRSWNSVASSSDGSKLVATVFGGQIYTSTDFGAIWTPRDSSRVWTDVASSSDGSKLVATVTGGQIYTSTDSGANWTPRDSHRNWQSTASSADGSKLVAVASNDRIYTSTDAGVNWTPRETARIWVSVTSSADGSKLAAVVSNGKLYTSTDSGVTWTTAAPSTLPGTGGYLTGGKSTAIELQYIGGGQFLPLSHQGTVIAH